VANLTGSDDGDWTVDAQQAVTHVEVIQIEQESELQVLATDDDGRRWDVTLGTDAEGRRWHFPTEPRLKKLVGEKLSNVVASTAGELRLEFSDGTVLRQSPLPRVEAWEIRCDEEPVLIGAPGGGVIVL
jgi:hypothetical protein